MAEYAGYVKRGTPINWGTVANDLVEKIGNVEKEQAAFRDKYDSIAAKTSAEIGKYEAGQSPQLNDLAYNMIADGRTTLSALHEKLKRREISPDAFNRAAMSMQTQNQEFKTMLGTYNANVADLEKGISDGTLSSLSDFQLDVYQDISDLSNKKFQWASNPDGITNLYVNTIDKDGNPVKQPMSLSSIRDMGNMRYEKYDIDTSLAKSIKSLGVYDLNNISDARDNPQYEKWKTSLINDATIGNRAATILADYGDFVPYKQGDDIPEDESGNKIGIEMVLKPNGQYEPNITPDLRDKAKTIVDESIEARVGRTETIDYEGQRLELAKEKAEEQKNKKPPSKFKPEDIEGFKTAHEITRLASAGKDFTGMDTKQYLFETEGDKGINVYSLSDGGTKGQLLTKNPLPFGTEKTQRVLSKYTKEFGNKPQANWDLINKQLKKESPKSAGDVQVNVKEVAKVVEPFKPSQTQTIAIENIYSNDMDVTGYASDRNKRAARESLTEFLEPLVGENNLVISLADGNNISVKIKGQEIGKMDLKDGSEDDLKKIISDAVKKSKEGTEFAIETASDNNFG